MRKTALGGIAVVFAAFAVWLAAAGGGRDAEATPSLAAAVERTAHAPSEHFGIHVTLARGDTPVSLHIRGQASRQTISVKMAMTAVQLSDGTRVQGPKGAALLDGPFLYERAPEGMALYGKIRWLRLAVPSLAPSSAALRAVHAMTPSPLLDVLRAAHMGPVGSGGRSFRGTIAYDDPAVRDGLEKLTGNIELRDLRVQALVGGDGLVHRVGITGRTADGKTRFALSARLFAFGEGVHVTPPAPGTFLDEHDRLTA